MSRKSAATFVPEEDILAYLEAILRVYNQSGRRDNIYKARIKILVNALGIDEMRAQVAREFEEIKANGYLRLPPDEMARIAAYFAPPDFEAASEGGFEAARGADKDFDVWCRHNLTPHRAPGYVIATISLKPIGGVPGDASAAQMEGIANLMDEFGLDEIRVSHEQNLILPHVKTSDLPAIFARLSELGLATPNAGLITDIIACPGLDYCDLANARAIPIAQRISERFADLARQDELGELKIKISGCINACGHHHAGHIGILGVDKKGIEFYQLVLGGSGAEDASIGDIMGPGFGEHEIADAVERVVERISEAARVRANASSTPIAASAWSRSRTWPIWSSFMPLIRNGDWAKDDYVAVADDAPLPEGPVLVSLERFATERETLLARNAKLGVRLSSSESPEALGDDVQRLSLIAIDFPVFKDGRGFSWARMLRTRLGYAGELRATGGFLVDQLAHLTRTGFDSFDGDARITPAALAQAQAEITNVYQPGPDGRKTIRELRAG